MCNNTASVALLTLSLTLLSASALDSQRRDVSPGKKAIDSLAGLPVEFVENRGQWGGAAAFVARQGHMAASLVLLW